MGKNLFFSQILEEEMSCSVSCCWSSYWGVSINRWSSLKRDRWVVIKLVEALAGFVGLGVTALVYSQKDRSKTVQAIAIPILAAWMLCTITTVCVKSRQVRYQAEDYAVLPDYGAT